MSQPLSDADPRVEDALSRYHPDVVYKRLHTSGWVAPPMTCDDKTREPEVPSDLAQMDLSTLREQQALFLSWTEYLSDLQTGEDVAVAAFKEAVDFVLNWVFKHSDGTERMRTATARTHPQFVYVNGELMKHQALSNALRHRLQKHGKTLQGISRQMAVILGRMEHGVLDPDRLDDDEVL